MHDLYKQRNLPYLNVKLCPECKKLIDSKENKCPNCNYDFILKKVVSEERQETTINEEKQKEANKYFYCENCGAKLLIESKYCSNCGTKVSRIPCPSCGTLINEDTPFCTVCGYKLINNQNSENRQTLPTDEQVKKEQKIENSENTLLLSNNVESNNDFSINSNKETINNDNIAEKGPAIELEDTKNDSETNDEIINDLPLEDIVRMPRKRLFIFFQLFITLIIFFMFLLMPVLVNKSILANFSSIISEVTESSKLTHESPMNGINYFYDIFKIIGKNSDNLSLIYSQVAFGNDNSLIFTCIPLIEKLINNANNSALISYTVVMVSLTIIIIGIINSLVTCIVGMFSSKPLKGYSLGILIICLLVGILFIYSSTFTNGYLGYDSWILYSFVISFILWFTIKLVFANENKLYKIKELEEKGKKLE